MCRLVDIRWNSKLLMERLRKRMFKPWRWHYLKKDLIQLWERLMENLLSPSLELLIQRLWSMPETLTCASLVILRQLKLFLPLKSAVNLRSILAAIGLKTPLSWMHLREASLRNVTQIKMVMMKSTLTSKDTFLVLPAVAWHQIGLYTLSQPLNIGRKWDSSWVFNTTDSTSTEQSKMTLSPEQTKTGTKSGPQPSWPDFGDQNGLEVAKSLLPKWLITGLWKVTMVKQLRKLWVFPLCSSMSAAWTTSGLIQMPTLP